MRVEMGVGNAEVAQFLREQTAQVFLLFGGRRGRRFRVGLRVDAHIAQEAFENGVGEFDRQDGHSGFNRHTRA